VERADPWARLLAAAGAAGAGAALVYVIGGASLSMRYDGFGLPGNQAAAQTPRELLLAAGLRTLVVWTLVGVALVLSLVRVPDATPPALARRLHRRRGPLAAAAVALVLLVVLDVWWPLAAFAALVVIVLVTVRWKGRPLARAVAGVAAVTLVAVAYEADRLTYVVERTCVTRALPAGSAEPSGPALDGPVCGTLVGQQERGFYLGVPLPGPGEHTPPQELVFVPADRVQQAVSRKQEVRVTTSKAEARREQLLSRLFNLRVR
jgi:hypothetical protein